MPSKLAVLRDPGLERPLPRPRIAAVAIALLMFFSVGPGDAVAQGFGSTDWPCQQRKVRHLSWGQMWAGPPLPEDPSAWRGDEPVNRLVGVLAARRTALSEAEALVQALEAGEEGRDRDARLVALFAGVFQQIDRERARIVDGIERLSRRERSRAERIETMRSTLASLRQDVAKDDYDTLDRIDELEDEVTWETRIYEDRRRSLQFVCESPVILEKRAFALARLIKGA
ncbi:MAG: hypothetical protein AAF416_19180, partial [Pseudomonadota bacterium]